MSTPPSSAAHGVWFACLAVLYSACQVNGLPEQSAMLVSVKPFAALACMDPAWPVVRSSSFTVNPLDGSVKSTVTTSPVFIRSVCALPRNVAAFGSCGAGGPAGTPLVWMSAKLTGSSQPVLQVVKLN